MSQPRRIRPRLLRSPIPGRLQREAAAGATAGSTSSTGAGSCAEAFEELDRHAGRQFDPGLVPLFIEEADRLESGIAPSVALPPAALLGRDTPIVTGTPGGSTAQVA